MPNAADLGRQSSGTLERIERIGEAVGRLNERVEGLSSSVGNAQRAASSASSQINGVISSIENGMNGLKSVMEQVLSALQNIRSGGGGGRARQQEQQMIHTIGELTKEYEKLGIDLKQYNLDLQSITITERQYNKVTQLATEFNRERADSYDGLSAKYKALKIIYDQLTASEQKSMTDMAATLRQQYEQMNLLQQATGKYQLQVGDYSKAMTGLNIATTQVVREMPTLANSVQQFVIAISNNIPILLDQIEAMNRQNKVMKEVYAAAVAEGRAEEELAAIRKRIIPTWKALLGSVFSYQTAIIVLLTVIPRLIRAFRDKKKAKEEDEKATKDLINAENALYKVYEDYANSATKNLVKLRLVYEASQDLKLSEDERLKAVKTLNHEFGETFKNFTEEEILLGKAKDAYDRLTNAIERSALAQAYYNKISEAQSQLIDLKIARDMAKERENIVKTQLALAKQEQTAAQEAYDAELEYMKQFEGESITAGNVSASTQKRLRDANKEVNRLTKSLEEQTSVVTENDSAMQDAEFTIQRLIDSYKAEGLYDVFDDKGGRGRKAKESMNRIADYYWLFWESITKEAEDGISKELAVLNIGYQKQLSDRQKQKNELLRIQKEGNAEERAEATRQLHYLEELMLSEARNFRIARQRIVQDSIDSFKLEVDESNDTLKMIQTNLKIEKDLRDSQAYSTYTTKADLEEKLRASEEQYWRDYLQRLTESGELTIELYNQIMAKLVKATSATVDKERKRSRNKYRSFVDFLFAQDQGLGETDKYGMRVVKDEFKDMADGINTALKSTISYMKEWMSTRIEMAKIAVEKAKEQSDAAKSALDAEMQARANGYANNVQMARAEYEEKKRLENEAIREQERLEKLQAKIDEANQISSMVTAIANIWKGYTAKTPLLATILASAATATMLGSFAAAKIAAAQVTRAKTYGEGGVEYLDYGGSHASGHDIDFGVSKDGTRRRVERGEMVGVISKRSVAQYGVSAIADVINSLNGGTFDKQYGAALATLAWEGTDLSKVEKGIDTLVEQNGRKIVLSDGKTIEYYKNTKRIIHGR